MSRVLVEVGLEQRGRGRRKLRARSADEGAQLARRLSEGQDLVVVLLLLLMRLAHHQIVT